MDSSGMPPLMRPRSPTGLHSSVGANPLRHLHENEPGELMHSVDATSHWLLKHSLISARIFISAFPTLSVPYILTFALGRIVEFLVLATSDDAVPHKFVSLETLHPSFVVKVIRARWVSDETILDFWELAALRSSAGRHVSRPRTVAHAKNNRMSASDVARFALVTNDGSVAATQTVQYGNVRMRHFR